MFYRAGHTSSTWLLHFIILFGPFRRLFINLTMCIRALFSKSTTTLGLVEQAFWRVPPFHKMSYCKFLWRNPCRAIETFYHWDSGSRCIYLILPRRRAGRRIRLCHFCTLIDIVTESTIVSFRTLPVGFPLPTISKNSLSTLFCP